MSKMHLGARVPNEGARRLAWWIGRECYGSMPLAARKLLVPATTLQRLLAGEITPGEELCRPLGEGSRNAVSRLDWQRPPRGGWFDVPEDPRLRMAA